MLNPHQPDTPGLPEQKRSSLFPRMGIFLQAVKGYFASLLKWIDAGRQKSPACKH